MHTIDQQVVKYVLWIFEFLNLQFEGGGIHESVVDLRTENQVDMLAKNLAGPAFQKCAKVFVGDDVHWKKKVRFSE